MALVLNGSNQAGKGSPISGFQYPFALFGWCKTTSTGNENLIVSGQDGIDDEYNTIIHASTTATRAISKSGGSSAVTASAGINDTSWHNIAGYFGATNYRASWLDGASKSVSSATRVTGAPDCVLVGRRGTAGEWAGSIAYVAVYFPVDEADWESILAELQTKSPLLVQPGKLIHFWPLVSDALDSVGGNDLTLENSPSFDADKPTLLESLPNLTVGGKTPVAAWVPTLDNVGNGTLILHDLVSGTYNGTLTNMDTGTDWLSDNSNTYSGSGYALDFDGTNDSVECGALSIAGDWTITAWINQVAFNPAIAYVLGIGGNGGIFTEYGAESDSWGFHDGVNPVELLGSNLNEGVWYFLAVTRTGANYEFFLNTVSEGTAVGTGLGITSFSIGSRGGTTLPYRGKIDDIRIFDSVLSGTTLSALYNNGNGRGIVAQEQQTSQSIQFLNYAPGRSGPIRGVMRI